MPPEADEPKRGPGRPPRSTAGPQVKKTLNFTPDEVAHLVRTYGTVQAGVRELVSADIAGKKGKRK